MRDADFYPILAGACTDQTLRTNPRKPAEPAEEYQQKENRCPGARQLPHPDFPLSVPPDNDPMPHPQPPPVKTAPERSKTLANQPPNGGIKTGALGGRLDRRSQQIADTKKWLDQSYSRKVDGRYFAHQPIYGYDSEYSEPNAILRIVRTYHIFKLLDGLQFGSFLDVGGGEGMSPG